MPFAPFASLCVPVSVCELKTYRHCLLFHPPFCPRWSVIHRSQNKVLLCTSMQKLFNLFTSDFLTVCVHSTLMGSKYFLWDCTYGPCTEVMPRPLCGCACVCAELVCLVTCFVCDQSTTPLTIGRKKEGDCLVTEHFMSVRSCQLAVYGMGHTVMRGMFEQKAEKHYINLSSSDFPFTFLTPKQTPVLIIICSPAQCSIPSLLNPPE